MYATVEDIYESLYKFFARANEVEIVITHDCNIDCEHCYAKAFKNKEVVPDATIEKVIKGLNHEWLVTCAGGEPTLQLEKCKLTISMAHRVGAKSLIITNGWWGEDKKISNTIAAMNPTYLALSIDKYHQRRIPLTTVLKIGEHFERLKIKVFGLVTKSSGYVIPQTKLALIVNPLLSLGGAKHLELFAFENDQKNYSGQLIHCHKCGQEVFPNGDIWAICDVGREGCMLGNVNDGSFITLYNQTHVPRHYIPPRYTYVDRIMVCKNMRVDIRDKKWADPDYVEIYGGNPTDEDIIHANHAFSEFKSYLNFDQFENYKRSMAITIVDQYGRRKGT